jgi:hypothetical protein
VTEKGRKRERLKHTNERRKKETKKKKHIEGRKHKYMNEYVYRAI